MKKMFISVATFVLVTMAMAQNPIHSSYCNLNENAKMMLASNMAPSLDRTDMMAFKYNLNEKQTTQLRKLNQEESQARQKVRTKYLEKMQKATPEKKLKWEKKMTEKLEALQNDYNDNMYQILNRRQYKKYCMDFQLRQAKFYQAQVRKNENRA